jgi:RimJ/RimL family protein N-acetyltransferase
MNAVSGIQTERLWLRQWKHSDFQPFSEMGLDERVMEFFPSLLDKKESEAVALKCQGLIEDRGWGFWAVELKESGQFIGFIGLHVPTAALPFSPCVEVGWRLARPYWGKGYATEGAKASIRFGFSVLGLTEIVAFTSVLNIKSMNVMRKSGMERSGTFNHPDISPDHRLYPHVLYGIRRDNWENQSERGHD